MINARKIIWQKWIDPFNEEKDEDEEDTSYKDSYQIAEEQQRKQQKQTSGPVLVGPMGVVPLNEHNIPSKVYNFWMGHCNFLITPVVQNILNSRVPGVESLDVFTPYRFRIAIGKAFEESEVKAAIQAALCPPVVVTSEKLKAKPADNLGRIVKHLKTKYKHWAVFALPDGTFDISGAETSDEINKVVKSRKEPTVATSE